MKKIMYIFFVAAWVLISFTSHSQSNVESNWELLLEVNAQELMDVHHDLNPIFWRNEQLTPEVEARLNRLGQFYFKKLKEDMPGVQLKDIVFIGSMVDYLYNSHSDLDINLLIDTTKIHWPDKALTVYLKQTNKYWHTQKAMLLNYPIEVGVYTQLSTLGGMYSLLKQSWLKKPEPREISFSKESLINLVQAYHQEGIVLQQEYTDDPRHFNCDKFNQFNNQIIKWRKDGLEREGLTSIENIGYRLLRALGELDRIHSLSLECQSA